MAKYRQLQTKFWDDPFIGELTPEQKLFYVYLITNPSSSQCGIYEITKRKIAFDTGYNVETVDKLIRFFEEKGKVKYSAETDEICIRNFIKHNASKSPKVVKCIQDGLAEVKNKDLIGYLYGIETLSQEKEKEKEEQQKKEKEAPESDFDFEDFKKAYGKQSGEYEAKEEWEKLTLDEIKKIKKNLAPYLISTPDKKFRKKMVNYLKQKIFNDDPESYRPPITNGKGNNYNGPLRLTKGGGVAPIKQ